MLDRLTVLLPCKPDRAQRSVKIGQDDVAMQMAGCEVGEVLYAVSHVQVKSVEGVPNAVQNWQAVALSNLRATSPQTLPWLVPKGASTAVRLSASGQRTHGGEVQAQLVWFSAGLDIYHLAVYAPHLAPEHSESLLSDLRIQ
ncbi:MAG: hypothetical protein RL392_1560 [Pseudomonadota bacterium]|jgi:hypothetical protein